MPRVVIFAGPNGAGKTTHAEPLLETLGISTFVNADYIARGLSGRNTSGVNFEAGRIMLNRIHALAQNGEDFAFESTLSSRSFAFFLRQLKKNGYRVIIFYFSLANARLAHSRVKFRVKLGGHDVPQHLITRRFHRSLKNFFTLYQPLADAWALLDNSSGKNAHLVAEYNGAETIIRSVVLWKRIQRQAS